MIIYETPNITRTLYSDKDYMHQQWLGYTKPEDWRKSQLMLISQIRDHKIIKIISDTRKLSVIPIEESEWMAQEIIPLLSDNGLEFLAIIQPKDNFTKMAVDVFKAEAQKHITIKYFKTFEEAEKWIVEK